MEPEYSLPCSEEPANQFRSPVQHFVTSCFIFRREVFSPSPNPQAGGRPLVGCPRLVILYIHNYPRYLEAASSIRNPRTRHIVVTRTHCLKLAAISVWWQYQCSWRHCDEIKSSQQLFFGPQSLRGRVSSDAGWDTPQQPVTRTLSRLNAGHILQTQHKVKKTKIDFREISSETMSSVWLLILRTVSALSKTLHTFIKKSKAVPVFLTEHHSMKAYWGVEV
jgi:hypothetical protein